ncbi:elongation factor P lysine(34) lysyltransferase, partial [Vibrio cholerae]|nr:elongation factor P lysine(34) lysyltransferase [Vibrio cholerae]
MNNFDWMPTALLSQLKQRATLLRQHRAFFIMRNLLEGERKVMSPTTMTGHQLH